MILSMSMIFVALGVSFVILLDLVLFYILGVKVSSLGIILTILILLYFDRGGVTISNKNKIISKIAYKIWVFIFVFTAVMLILALCYYLFLILPSFLKDLVQTFNDGWKVVVTVGMLAAIIYGLYNVFKSNKYS